MSSKYVKPPMSDDGSQLLKVRFSFDEPLIKDMGGWESISYGFVDRDTGNNLVLSASPGLHRQLQEKGVRAGDEYDIGLIGSGDRKSGRWLIRKVGGSAHSAAPPSRASATNASSSGGYTSLYPLDDEVVETLLDAGDEYINRVYLPMLARVTGNLELFGMVKGDPESLRLITTHVLMHVIRNHKAIVSNKAVDTSPRSFPEIVKELIDSDGMEEVKAVIEACHGTFGVDQTLLMLTLGEIGLNSDMYGKGDTDLWLATSKVASYLKEKDIQSEHGLKEQLMVAVPELERWVDNIPF